MMVRPLVVSSMIALAGFGLPVQAADAARGGELYESRCFGCHSLDANRIGPMHRGVFGRKAGSVADFAYSAAVKNAAVVWDEATLDRWLANTQAVIPGTRMNFRVANAEDRADIIAYLKKESGK
ncbi:MAG TPA: c-type cytochrome [Alphaproteobacteria bacterium]|nr:c-type cytochrome [Alphaproteobacteria bacterium]